MVFLLPRYTIYSSGCSARLPTQFVLISIYDSNDNLFSLLMLRTRYTLYLWHRLVCPIIVDFMSASFLASIWHIFITFHCSVRITVCLWVACDIVSICQAFSIVRVTILWHFICSWDRFLKRACSNLNIGSRRCARMGWGKVGSVFPGRWGNWVRLDWCWGGRMWCINWILG